MSGISKSAVVTCIAAIACIAADAAPLRADHPALGTWEWVIPGASCTERMSLLKNGTTAVTSGAEISQSDARIADKPDADGFFEWVDTVTTSNGKPGCAGSVTPIGDVATTYLRVSADGDKLLLCESKKGPCFGPYIRQQP